MARLGHPRRHPARPGGRPADPLDGGQGSGGGAGFAAVHGTLRRDSSAPPCRRSGPPRIPRSPWRPWSGSRRNPGSRPKASRESADRPWLRPPAGALRRRAGRSGPTRERSTETTLPMMTAWSPRMGSYWVFCGSSQVWPSRWRNVLTVASSSSRAATMSPLTASPCRRTTTQSPSQMAASIIESPATLSMKSSPWPTSWRGQGHDVLDDLVGQDRSAGGDAADQRHHGRVGGAGQFRNRQAADGAQAAGLLDPEIFAVPSSRVSGISTSMARGALGVAPQVAELLELRELVGDAGEAGQADGVADFAHGRRVAVVRHGALDGFQDLLLPDGEALGGRAACGLRGWPCRRWLVLPCSPTPFRSARPPWLRLPGTSGLKCQTLLINCRSGCSLTQT